MKEQTRRGDIIKKCFKWIPIILIFIFIGYLIGYAHGANTTVNYCFKVADKFLNITLTPEGEAYVKTYAAKARIMGLIK